MRTALGFWLSLLIFVTGSLNEEVLSVTRIDISEFELDLHTKIPKIGERGHSLGIQCYIEVCLDYLHEQVLHLDFYWHQ